MNAARIALALAPLALLHDGLRGALEARMATHMLVEFPLLFAAGWSWVRLARLEARALAAVDAHGLVGMTVASCVGAFWMIPAALDASLVDPRVAAAKLASWIAAGALLALGRPRIGAGAASFFAGHLAWMLASAGLLYREAGQRLCVSYALADQLVTGNALVALAVVLVGALGWRWRGWLLAPAAQPPVRGSTLSTRATKACRSRM